jgi:hypothetical protein
MGQLKPGATYIYEKADGVTYAREIGSNPGTRFPIGWDYNDNENHFNAKFWGDVLRESKNNHTLRLAVERVIVLYHLSKDNGT